MSEEKEIRVIVRVQFATENQMSRNFSVAYGGKSYEYFATAKLVDLEIDKATIDDIESVCKAMVDTFQYAVVDSPYSGFCVVRVMSISPMLDKDYKGTLKPVVALINTAYYEAAKKKEEERQKLIRRANARADELRKTQSLRILAEQTGDAELAEMLRQLKELE